MAERERKETASERHRAGIFRRIARHRSWALLCAVWLGFTIKAIALMGHLYPTDTSRKAFGAGIGIAAIVAIWLLPLLFPRGARGRKTVIAAAAVAASVYIGCYVWLLLHERGWKRITPLFGDYPFRDSWYSFLCPDVDYQMPDRWETFVASAYSPLRPLTDLTAPGRRHIYDPWVLHIPAEEYARRVHKSSGGSRSPPKLEDHERPDR